MSGKKRRKFTPEEIMAILRKHLLDKVPVSEVCDEHGLNPTVFYRWEREAIVAYYRDHPLEGYRRLTYMMLDADVVAVSPSSVYRVLKEAELMDRWNRKLSKKGQGFEQPQWPHEHWHVDICYINIGGTFYYLCSLLDGFRFQPVYRALGDPGIDDRTGRGDHHAACPGGNAHANGGHGARPIGGHLIP